MTTQQPKALRLAEKLRDMCSQFDTPSHERGVVNGAIHELRRLQERLGVSQKSNTDWAARTHALEAANAKLRAELDELTEQMAAIGAGGVEPLRKRSAVKESLTTESTVNQKVTVQVPPFATIAQHKLDEQLAKGFRVVGYTLEHCNILQDTRRCTVDYNGLVRWVPSAEQEVAKERAARQAAQVEVVELKERIARAGVEQRRAVREAVLQEREACAPVAEDGFFGDDPGDLNHEIAAAIRSQP